MGDVARVKIGWVAIEIVCARCRHAWVLVAPFDIANVTCDECGYEMSVASIATPCSYCLRPLDDTVTGDAPCPLCSMPMVQNECYHA